MKVYQYLNEIRLMQKLPISELSSKSGIRVCSLYGFLTDDQSKKSSTTASIIADALGLPAEEDEVSCIARIARYYRERCKQLSDPEIENFRSIILHLSESNRELLFKIAQLLAQR